MAKLHKREFFANKSSPQISIRQTHNCKYLQETKHAAETHSVQS